MKPQLSKTILLVEDNRDDVFAFRRALKFSHVANPLQVVTDGQKAVEYLSGIGIYADREQYPLPFIIFLDLKLPYVTGFDVLAWIRRQRELSSIVVVVLTGSAETRDQDAAYKLGARTYLVKPPTPETLGAIFTSLDSYWHSSRWLAQNPGTPVLCRA